MAKHWEVRLSINYAMLAMLRSVLSMLLLSHLFACLWGLQTSFSDRIEDTWLFAWGYCRHATTTSTSMAEATHECDPPSVQYGASLYWAVMTITSIGYGDNAATPGNPVELYICAFLMLSGSMLWAQVLATFVSVLSTLNMDANEFRQMMDSLNAFMRRHNIPQEMRLRLREYFHQTQHLRVAERQKELIEFMSPSLQSEVAWQCNKQWLQRIWFLRDSPVRFLVSLARQLVPVVFAPGELAPLGALYIVHRGLALYAGKILGVGKVWGFDVILSSMHLQFSYCARAMNYLEVYAMHREALDEVSMRFPQMQKRIRHEAVRMATRRAFILEAQRMRQQEDGRCSRSEATLNGGSQLSRASTFDKMLLGASIVYDDSETAPHPGEAPPQSPFPVRPNSIMVTGAAASGTGGQAAGSNNQSRRSQSQTPGAQITLSSAAAGALDQVTNGQQSMEGLLGRLDERQVLLERKVDYLVTAMEALVAASPAAATQVASAKVSPPREGSQIDDASTSVTQVLLAPLSSMRTWRSGRTLPTTADETRDQRSL